MPGPSPLRAWWARRPPAAGAAVTATGVVSVALHPAGRELLSRIALALACVARLGLAAELVLRLLRARRAAGGALAVSALAGPELLLAAGSARPCLWNEDGTGVLRTTTAALFLLDPAWGAALPAAECARPRPRYDTRRWATVFPLGMTAAALSAAAGLPWLEGPGRVLVRVAVAA